jgi:hypothetical protein
VSRGLGDVYKRQHLADPPMTKDAVAGRIRRLLAMADKKASDLGIPATDAFIPDDLPE